jgi:hypothetical protein
MCYTAIPWKPQRIVTCQHLIYLTLNTDKQHAPVKISDINTGLKLT